MELKGKKINFLGDSITEGHGTSCKENCYVSVFGRLSGAEVLNYGIGGTRIAVQTNPSSNEVCDKDFIGRVDEMESDADIIVVFGGTNDFGHGDAALGDFSSRDPHTFYGAMHTLCEKLINKYPKSQFVFITPLHRTCENKLINSCGARTAAPLSKYVEIIKEVTKYYAIPTLDLYSTSGIQPEVEIIRQTYMPDGLHPNDEGAKKIAERLLGFLKSL